jgi:hypothetical protein
VLIGIDRWVAVKYPMKSKFLNTARFVVSYWHMWSWLHAHAMLRWKIRERVAHCGCNHNIIVGLTHVFSIFQVFIYVISFILSLPQVSLIRTLIFNIFLRAAWNFYWRKLKLITEIGQIEREPFK